MQQKQQGDNVNNNILTTAFYSLTNVTGLHLRYSKKKKSKAVPLHAMEAHWRRGGIAPTHS
jgi:hypothetical protein